MDVGNGRTIKFWEDIWLPSGRLKEMFPRLFSVSNLTGSVIGECGFWDGLEWIWSFQWRRELFQWELELLHQLHEVMQKAALPEEITSYSFTSAIWRGFAPPRVELFSWFVLVERVNTKERLCKLGVIDQHDNMCVLCVWCAWLFALGRIWAMPGTIKQHFESWSNASQRKNERRRWLIGFFTVIWAIWIERNGRVFNNKGSGVMEIINRSFMLSDEWLGGEPPGR
ncbi:uncharacterized protein LOC107606331 [Arachis ipaensis]|uniref:uncharacterized protein LOC107606331 n=1 Tax=Arachis ipaensis TaxID=130454 RepID=UPI0007AFC8DC|nr:uncharacterized protein LOC107606331 [Arachis ipaensis]